MSNIDQIEVILQLQIAALLYSETGQAPLFMCFLVNDQIIVHADKFTQNLLASESSVSNELAKYLVFSKNSTEKISIAFNNSKILPKLSLPIRSKKWNKRVVDKTLVIYLKLLGYGHGGINYGAPNKIPIWWNEDSIDLKWEDFSRGPLHHLLS